MRKMVYFTCGFETIKAGSNLSKGFMTDKKKKSTSWKVFFFQSFNANLDYKSCKRRQASSEIESCHYARFTANDFLTGCFKAF